MSPGSNPDRPLPVVARELVTDVQTLVSQEISLAKAEVADVVGKAAKAAALFAVAGVLALYLLGFGLSFVARLLAVWLPEWAAWLIVVGLIVVLIVALAVIGKRMLPTSAPGTAAREELDETKVVVTARVDEIKRSFADQVAAAAPATGPSDAAPSGAPTTAPGDFDLPATPTTDRTNADG